LPFQPRDPDYPGDWSNAEVAIDWLASKLLVTTIDVESYLRCANPTGYSFALWLTLLTTRLGVTPHLDPEHCLQQELQLVVLLLVLLVVPAVVQSEWVEE